MNNVETTIVPLTVRDNTNTTHVASTSHHSHDTSIESDELGDLTGRQIDLDGIVDLNRRIGISDAIVSSISMYVLPTKHWSNV